jgi:hypothetical protein
MGGGESGRPSGIGSRPAEQPATDEDGAGQRQPELDHQPAALGAPAQLPYWLPQAWVRSITHRRPAWTGAGMPRVAILSTIPRSARTCRHGW